MIVLIFDTETTGLTKHSLAKAEEQPRIIELGLIRWDLATGKTLEWSQLFSPGPGVRLESVITKITGLTDADLVGKPVFADCANTVASHFAKANALVGHNVEFDQRTLTAELQRCAFPKFPWPKTTICTVRQYEWAFGYRPKMEQLYEYVLKKKLVQTHRALDDCRALLEILQHDQALLFPLKQGVLR